MGIGSGKSAMVLEDMHWDPEMCIDVYICTLARDEIRRYWFSPVHPRYNI